MLICTLHVQHKQFHLYVNSSRFYHFALWEISLISKWLRKYLANSSFVLSVFFFFSPICAVLLQQGINQINFCEYKRKSFSMLICWLRLTFFPPFIFPVKQQHHVALTSSIWIFFHLTFSNHFVCAANFIFIVQERKIVSTYLTVLP